MREKNTLPDLVDFSAQHYTCDTETLAIRTHLYRAVLGVEPASVVEEDVPNHEAALRSWWRQRAVDLGRAGWGGGDTPERLSFLRKCYSFRAVPDSGEYACNRTWLCPYCWARRVAAYIAPLRACLAGGRPGRQLVGFAGGQAPWTTNSYSPEDQLREAKIVRKTEHWMAPPGFTAIGGLSYLCPVFVDGSIFIERRGLVVVGRKSEQTEPLAVGRLTPWRGSVQAAGCFSPEPLASALTGVVSFPDGFFEPPAPEAVRFIRGLKSARLLSDYGGGVTPLKPVGLRRGGKNPPAAPSPQRFFGVEEWSRQAASRNYSEPDAPREDDEYYGDDE
jgi:hypothetical protein